MRSIRHGFEIYLIVAKKEKKIVKTSQVTYKIQKIEMYKMKHQSL